MPRRSLAQLQRPCRLCGRSTRFQTAEQVEPAVIGTQTAGWFHGNRRPDIRHGADLETGEARLRHTHDLERGGETKATGQAHCAADELRIEVEAAILKPVADPSLSRTARPVIR